MITKNQIFFQLSINEIYVTDKQPNDLTFCYYESIITIQNQINKKLRSCHNPKVLLFLDDHGSPGYFGFLPFFSIYDIFLKNKLSFLYILNDSCYSGSTIQMVNNYFTICEYLKGSKIKISNPDLKFITYVAEKIKPRNLISDLKKVLDILYKCQNDDSVIINEFINYIIQSYPNQQSQDELENLRNIKLFNFYQTNFGKEKMIFEETFNDFLEKGIETIGDLLDVNLVITKFKKFYSRSCPTLNIILDKIKLLKPIYDDIQNKLNCSKNFFYRIIIEMFNQGIDFESVLYERPTNHFIITSTHSEGCSPTFGTISISESQKIIAGSPAMSVYIIETFMLPQEDGISID